MRDTHIVDVIISFGRNFCINSFWSVTRAQAVMAVCMVGVSVIASSV